MTHLLLQSLVLELNILKNNTNKIIQPKRHKIEINDV